MDRCGTKTPGEREDEEIERLVRPSPKVKPPRHDRRRERVEVDHDPDLENRDKDLSRNFKDIGGSLASRVVSRWAAAKLPQPGSSKAPSRSPTPPPPAGAGTKAPTISVGMKVKVRSKATGWVGWISRERLQRDSAAYEVAEEDEEPAAERGDGAEPKAPAGNSEQTGDKTEHADALHGAERDRAAQTQLLALSKDDPSFAAFLKSFKNPQSEVSQFAKNNPGFNAKPFMHGQPLPPGIETIGDLARAVTAPNSAKSTSKKRPPSVEPPSQDPTGERPPVQLTADPPTADPPAPVDPAASPADHSQAGSSEAPTSSKAKKTKKPEGPKEPAYAASQPSRQVSESERHAADRLVIKTFPPSLAAKLLIANPPYHPDEVRDLVSDYNLGKSIVAGGIEALLTKASKFYSLDPNAVQPPKMAQSVDGKVAAFSSLPQQEQAQAHRRHQVQTVALSLAAQTAVASDFEQRGAPKELSYAMSSFLLSSSDETPTNRMKRAEAEAESLFYAGLKRKEPPLSDGTVAKLLQISGDPAIDKLIVGYCQAKDYQDARSLFLDPKSDDHISEFQPPNLIATRIAKAADFLRSRAERYPRGAAGQDTHAIFRDRVMKHLAQLSPGKQAAVQDLLDETDNRRYETQLQKYEKASKAYQKEARKEGRNYSADYKAYSKMLERSGNYDADPPLSVEDRLLLRNLEAPKPPAKPPRYDALTKSPERLRKDSLSFWKDFLSRNGSDQRLATRIAARNYSSYLTTCAMDRAGVYWGVAPYPKSLEPYKDWEQPQARDLGESNLARILEAARNWLSTPLLSTNIDGIFRDTQLRAALDLALRSQNYDHTIHPTVYNQLLARLAGEPENKTLPTVESKTARNTMSNKKVELETAQADLFLARLDRIASVVQSNHKQWGMGFVAAKNLVNAIDKLADDLESATYGAESLLNRQASEIGQTKLAQVIERDSDESYMDTFENPQRPLQTEADEPYMAAYNDDQSSAVRGGKSLNGRPLAR